MLKKVLSYGVVICMALVLVGGSIYILARPENTETVNRELVHETSKGGDDDQGQGQVDRDSNESRQNQTDNNSDGNGNGSGQGNESLYSDDSVIAFETIEGTVTEAGNELLVATTDGDVLVGLGPEFYRDETEFTVSVGDSVSVMGYPEDGEFKAATIKNLSSNTSIVLRDESGRPMWSGRGNQQNLP